MIVRLVLLKLKVKSIITEVQRVVLTAYATRQFSKGLWVREWGRKQSLNEGQTLHGYMFCLIQFQVFD